MIIVEVLSRSTRHVDTAIKLPTYFRVPSVMHYLLFDPTEPLIICHTRSAGDAIVTRSLREGVITLDPPGFEIAVKDVYGQ
jgi:Uma2 family endonuclease